MNISWAGIAALATAMPFAVTPAVAQKADTLAFFKGANAQTPAPTPELVTTLLKDSFEKARLQNAQVCVPSSITVSDIKPATADAGVWAGIRAGKLRNAWTAKAEMGGCALRDANYLVLRFNADGPPAFREIIYSRGSTLAGMSLSKDATTAVLGGVAVAVRKANLDANGPPQCASHPVYGVREFIDANKAGPDVYGVRFVGEWTERWHFDVCGHDVGVPVRFTADGQGGAYFHVDPQTAVVN